MLKNLQNSLSKHHIAVPSGDIDKLQISKCASKDNTAIQMETSRGIRNTDAACNIVNHIFRSIDICLQEDKSKVKLSGFTKSFIKSILTNSVKGGIGDFIRNMNDREVQILLDDIQNELSKRR